MPSSPSVQATSSSRANDPSGDEPVEDVLLEELLVEEVSIDGMCGVY